MVDSFLLPASINVEAVPTSVSTIAVFITVSAPGQSSVVTELIFDITNGINKVIPEKVDQKPLGVQHDNSKHEVTENKYMLRRGR